MIKKHSSKSETNSKKYLLIACLVIGLIVFVAIAMALNVYNDKAQRYEEGVALMKAGVQSTVNELIKSKVGAERRALFVENGKYSDSFLCIDVTCLM